MGKWEVELYRKQRAWDSDSNFVVPKAHKLWQSAPVAHIYTHFTIISSNNSRLLRLVIRSRCVHRFQEPSAQKGGFGLFNRHLATKLRQSKSNYDFCENCSSLYRWRLVWWDGLAKRSFNFQMVSGYIKPIYSKQTGSDLLSRNGMTRQLFLCERRI